MRQFRILISILPICLFSFSVHGQKTKVDTKHYRLDKTTKQNKSIFAFWVGTDDSTKRKLIIERTCNNKSIIIYNDFVRDGIYSIADRNNDGYKDFITNYHDFDVIYFFDQTMNNFKNTPIYMPMTFGMIDSVKYLYWGYREAQYAEAYDYSILYSYTGFTPKAYYKVVYKTPDGHSERSEVNAIELYRFKNNDYTKPVLVQRIKTADPKRFDYKNFWKANYRQLLGYR